MLDRIKGGDNPWLEDGEEQWYRATVTVWVKHFSGMDAHRHLQKKLEGDTLVDWVVEEWWLDVEEEDVG